ncbi:ectopic P granules protein 5 homolog isoform X2 [Crotalus tigris]|uniref:ectopic P granules protein 5 homolog isoform X2 n=1 Tax=Crotalus tigris TaxID=88082 RepID=UPI00192F269A|nr:ectopic P granules protein 5 homolog isoform X2 [Crotalus tigris]
MAEVVKPRSRSKAGRVRAKEKKKKDEEKESTIAQLSLDKKIDEEALQEKSTPEGLVSSSRPCPAAPQKETGNRDPKVPPSLLTPENEGPPAAPQTEPLLGAEPGANILQEEKDAKMAERQGLKEGAVNVKTIGDLLGKHTPPAETAPRSSLAEDPAAPFSEKVRAPASLPETGVKAHPETPLFKNLYPDLSALLSEGLPEFTFQWRHRPEALYPALPAHPELAPFTKEQLKIFEPCSWLENVEAYAEEFGSVAHQDRHAFYELVLNYGRCRKQLLLAETKLQSLSLDGESVKDRLWTFRDQQQSAQGVCADQCKVSGFHRYQTVEVNEGALEELKKLLDLQTEHLHQILALHLYTSVLSRLQVESYLHNVLRASPLLRSLGLQPPESTALKTASSPSSDLGPLKDCISVLFSFTRRATEDPQFQSDVLSWLRKLVALLQRVASPGDHLFLLNHILRCPAGVSKWAAPFIQIQILDNPSGVFHFMQALALLMSPAKNRAEFMCHMKPSERSLSSSEPGSGNWTLVDEGGEEDEDPETSWVLLLEDDLVALLTQFPFHELFQHMLGFDAKGSYVPEKTTSQTMMKMLAFANSVVNLLAVGLETFNRARYRQFVKRIGHLIRMTLCHVSDHWAQFVSCAKESGPTMAPYSLKKLQVEFDEFFLRAVLHVLKAKRLGVWLFMSEMPYGILSSDMLWKLFSIMHCDGSEDLEKFTSTLQLAELKQKLKDPAHLETFERYLQSMNSSEEICLLTTFAQMAQTKREDVDEDFVKVVVLEIYEISYVCLSTRETFSKVGRELLASITAVHPTMISVVLDRVRETIESVGMVTLYLFKELPMLLWKPSASEIALLRDWLLNYSLTEVENKLACIILEEMNWGPSEQQGYLHIDPAVHAEVALMILEAYQMYLPQKPYSGLLSESFKQVSYLASIVRYGETPESSFNQWAWGMILRLKLHRNDYGVQGPWPPSPIPDLTDSPSFHPLLKAVRSSLPIGCYLALAMSAVGHSIDSFCAEGISFLGILVQSRHLRTVVHVLDKVLLLFYPCHYYLLKNEKFLSFFHQFLQLDSGAPQGMTQQMTHRVTQHLTWTSYGKNVKLLNSMIQGHIFMSSHPSGIGPAAVFEFWVQLLTSQPLWHKERAVLELMDGLCQAAFQFNQEDCLQKLLYQQHKNALGYHSDKGLLSSLVSWIVAGNITPSFIEGNANPTQVWFAWSVLNMESIFEEDSQLRRVVVRELVTSSVSPDQALKKAQSQLKLPMVPSLQRLLIYRWAHQALSTPVDHPLLPLICQKFFLLYLQRPGLQDGLPNDGCVGRRFFQAPTHLSLLNDLKQHLIEATDFHHSASKMLQLDSPAGGSEHPTAKGFSKANYVTFLELHKDLVRLFSTFVLWLEEERFQKGDIYIPSLPKQYDGHRLAKIMQNQQDLWMEFVNVQQIQHEFQETLDLWFQVRVGPLPASSASPAQTDFTDPLLAKERIISSLKKYDEPQPLLPLQPMKAPVPVISPASLVNQHEAKELTCTNLRVFQQHAKRAALRESQQVAFSSEMLDTLPKLYINREEQVTLHLECRAGSGKRCHGAAHVTIQFEGKHKNEAIRQQLDVLEKEMKHLQAEAAQMPPLSVVGAAVYVENFITGLINIYKLQPSPRIQRIGISLFFAIVEYVSDETQRHPPSRQFFTSCIEILGQVFIMGTKSECQRVLQTILKNRRLCTLLSPYFTPVASPEEFVNLYEKVVAFLGDDNSDVIFMLLTKFDLLEWLQSSKPALSERGQLLESIHVGLKTCGFEPEKDVLMPFSIFCKHWVCLLQYQFPDHYSSFLRLLLQSSSDQLLSPDCWKASLKGLGCPSSIPAKENGRKEMANPSLPLQPSTEPILSPEQVMETIEWLSDYFLKLRLSSQDYRSFGLFSKWAPYVAHVKRLMQYLLHRLIDSKMDSLSREPIGSNRVFEALHSLFLVTIQLFKPWLEVLEGEETSKQRCYPWLESDASLSSTMVELFASSVDILHNSFKDKVLPSDPGVLWLLVMHYSESYTAPKMPEHILHLFHTELGRLPWKEVHPDQHLMEKFFKVERGSPKSCFLFLGSVLCEVNWVSALADAWDPTPPPDTHSLIVCLLYMVVLLAKEEELVTKEQSPLLNLLGQASSLPWQHVNMASYQSILSYFNSHYSPSILLATEPAAELVVKLLKVSAGLSPSFDSSRHPDASLKCQAFIRQIVRFLGLLEQNGTIAPAVLEQEFSKLLEDIALFSPPGADVQLRSLSLTSLFAEALMVINNASAASAESLLACLCRWIGSTLRGLGVMPLLRASCQSLASVQHMAMTMEACVTAYFNEDPPLNQDLGWGPIVASLQVPELAAEDFLQVSLSSGGYLTLYVYTLQQLKAERTPGNEMRALLTLSKWSEQVFPSSAQDEAKLFLWWHKILQLCLLQAEQEDPILMESVIRVLTSLQGRQSLLAEERLTSGLLGALGLGRRSPLSNRFRVLARSMSAFLLVQLPLENQIRLRSGLELQPSSKAQQALNALDSLASNKPYAEYQGQILQASQFIKDSQHCLHDGTHLLAILLNTLYAEVRYLDAIR